MTDDVSPTPRQIRRNHALADARRFAVIAGVALAAAAATIVAVARFDFLGAGVHVNLAMVLGTLGAIALGVGLMGLTFYSNRSGVDDEVKADKEEGAL
ncbi:MAG: hypothetical protein ACKVS5_13360 [Parvularculaceae bacterium]